MVVSMIDGHIDVPKMMDEQIIKDYKYQVRCGAGSQRVLDLINRQKAKLEVMENRYDKLCNYLEKVERELAEKEMDLSWFKKPSANSLAPVVREIVAETRLDFAKRLKQKTKQIQITYNLEHNVVFVSEIDNLLKEMAGEQ